MNARQECHRVVTIAMPEMRSSLLLNSRYKIPASDAIVQLVKHQSRISRRA
jgi:hypothetical protein